MTPFSGERSILLRYARLVSGAHLCYNHSRKHSHSQKSITMQLVKQHILTSNDSRFEAVDRAAFAAKNLYNAANYLVRQSFINENHYLNYYNVHAEMKGHEAYQALPRKVS